MFQHRQFSSTSAPHPDSNNPKLGCGGAEVRPCELGTLGRVGTAEGRVALSALLPVLLGKAACAVGGLRADSCTGRSLLSHPSPAFI